MNLATHLHLMPRWRVYGAISPHSYIPSWWAKEHLNFSGKTRRKFMEKCNSCHVYRIGSACLLIRDRRPDLLLFLYTASCTLFHFSFFPNFEFTHVNSAFYTCYLTKWRPSLNILKCYKLLSSNYSCERRKLFAKLLIIKLERRAVLKKRKCKE